MKRKSLLLFVMIAILILSVSAVACTDKDANGLKKLATPSELELNGSTISWAAVDKAETYYIKINETEVSTSATTYNIVVEEIGEYIIKVRAYGDGVKYGSSDWSLNTIYVKGERLAAPKVTVDNDTKTASWTAIDNAVKYSIKINNKQVATKDTENSDVIFEQETNETQFVFADEKFKEYDAYGITVIAYPSEDSKLYSKSLPSEMAKYVVSLKLEVPKIKSISESSISWESVEYANSYAIIVENESGTKTFTTKSTSYSTSLMELEPGKYEIRVKSVGDGVVFFDSKLSEKNPDYFIQQLGQIDKEFITYTIDDTGREYVKIIFPNASMLDGIKNIKLSLRAYKADRKVTLSNVDTKMAIEEDKLEYLISLDDMFFEMIDVEGSNNKEQKFLLSDEEDYAAMFEISVLAINKDDKKIFDSKPQIIDQKYRSYKIPRMNEENGNYIIENIGNLSFIEKYPKLNYELTKNLDFKGYEFRSITKFEGNFYGKNNTISNMVIAGKGENTPIAMFEELAKNATIRDLHLVGLNAKGYKDAKIVGGMVGINNGSITSSTVNGSIDINYYYDSDDKEAKKYEANLVGGLVGINNYEVSNCQSNVVIIGNAGGGLVGENNGTVSFSMSLGKVEVKLADETNTAEISIYGGGLVGKNQGLIYNSFSIGNVSAVGSNAVAGGLVAINNKTTAENSGIIYSSYAGKPYTKASISRATVSGSGNGAIVGGFVGKNNGEIKDCYSTAYVFSTNCAGGFVGENVGVINTAYSTGGTANNGSRIGGFAGDNATGTIGNAFYFSLTNSSDKGGAERIEENQLAEDLKNKLKEGNADTKFATMENGKAPVLKNMIYISEYKINIKKSEIISLKGKLVTNDDKTVELGKDLKVDGKETFDLFGSTQVAGNIIARYKYDSTYIFVFVTVK